MAFLKKQNNAQSSLSASISNSDLSLTVVDASSFPVVGDFLVTLWDKENYLDPSDDANMEIVKVTGVSGSVFTIERAQEGTVAQEHDSGVSVEMLITQGHFEEIEEAIEEHVADLNNPHQVVADQVMTDESGKSVQDKIDEIETEVGNIPTDKIEEGDTSAEVVDTGTDGHFKVTAEGTERLRVTANGNVGIGTSVPADKLHITGGHIRIEQWNASVKSYSGELNVGSANAHDMSLVTGNSVRLRVKSDGLIGIGTTAPSARLHTLATTEQLRLGYDTSNYVSTTVDSTGAVTLDAVGSGASFTFNDPVTLSSTLNTHTIPGGTGTLALTTDIPANDKIVEGNTEAEVVDTGSDGHFKVTTEGVERLRITADGNIGIGISTPSSIITQKNPAQFDTPILGNELLSSSGWTSTNWTGDFSTGFTHTVGFTNTLTNSLAAVTNNFYQVVMTVSGRTAGSCAVNFGGVAISTGIQSTLNIGVKATSTGSLVLTPTSDFNGKIVPSIKIISPNNFTNFGVIDSSGATVFSLRTTLASLNNLYFGAGSGAYNTNGNSNTAFGTNALAVNTSGTQNLAVGKNALWKNTSGGANVAIGEDALQNSVSASFNTAIGANAMRNTTTGLYNVAIGESASQGNTTGQTNVAVGRYALYSATGASSNVAIGDAACMSVSGGSNLAIGKDAMRNSTSGSGNVAMGGSALNSNSSGTSNIAIGGNALYVNATNSSNVSIGVESLRYKTTGSSNTVVGHYGARHLSNGTSNTVSVSSGLYLGNDTKVSADGVTNEIAIGSLAIGNGSNSVTLGHTTITKTILRSKVGIGSTAPTAELDVIGTTEQLRLGYDASNYFSTTVASNGAVTFNAVGSGASFNFGNRLDIDSDIIRVRTAKTPSSASDTGNAGDICWDSGYVYICVATDTWKRAELSTWA